jgi:hypothetical protein
MNIHDASAAQLPPTQKNIHLNKRNVVMAS